MLFRCYSAHRPRSRLLFPCTNGSAILVQVGAFSEHTLNLGRNSATATLQGEYLAIRRGRLPRNGDWLSNFPQPDLDRGPAWGSKSGWELGGMSGNSMCSRK